MKSAYYIEPPHTIFLILLLYSLTSRHLVSNTLHLSFSINVSVPKNQGVKAYRGHRKTPHILNVSATRLIRPVSFPSNKGP